jgi:hypothetical protein
MKYTIGFLENAEVRKEDGGIKRAKLPDIPI